MLLTHIKFEFNGPRGPSNSNLTWVSNIFSDPTYITRAVTLSNWPWFTTSFHPIWEFGLITCDHAFSNTRYCHENMNEYIVLILNFVG